MISELLRAGSTLRKSIDLPWLAQETTSAPVLRAFTLVIGHDLSLSAYRFRADADYSRA